MLPLTSQQRILGIDYGSKRIGLSISDPLRLIARPIDPLKNTPALFAEIKRIVDDDNVGIIVVGMPLNLKGVHAKKALEVDKFIEQLEKEAGIRVLQYDERFTTTIASRTMIEMGTKKKERQKKDGRLDSMAAAVMLQDYLDSMKYK